MRKGKPINVVVRFHLNPALAADAREMSDGNTSSLFALVDAMVRDALRRPGADGLSINGKCATMVEVGLQDKGAPMIRDDRLFSAGETLAQSQRGRGLLDLVQRLQEHGGNRIPIAEKEAFFELVCGTLGIEHRRAGEAVRAALLLDQT